jgi:photosystem II stability/assembly factor-like uncharacterized protein
MRDIGGVLHDDEFAQAAGPSDGFVEGEKVKLQATEDLDKMGVDASGFWLPIGPAPIRIDGQDAAQGTGPVSGIVLDVAIHPDDAKTIFVATRGGVWKSTDGGSTWSATMQNLRPLASVSALAIEWGKDHDVIFAATQMAGVYKSLDRGQTWRAVDGGIHASVFVGKHITRIVSNTADSLLVATSDGLYRSVDGGENFGNNPPNFDNGQAVMNGRISDLRLDADAPWGSAFVCISGLGVFRLDLHIQGTGPAVNLFSNPGAPKPPYSKIVLAQSVAPDGRTLYASVQFNDPKKGATYRGLFYSENGGKEWKSRPKAINAEQADARAHVQDQTDYDMTVGVDPSNAKRVFVGFQSLWASSNAGLSFGVPACSEGQIHLDHHALQFGTSAGDPSPLYVGEDGGLAFSADGGLTWKNLNETIATNLVNKLDTGRGTADNSQYTFAAMQDTGVAGHRLGDTGLDWHLGLGGDGWDVAVDPANPQIVYAISNEVFYKTTNAGARWDAVGKGLPQKKGNPPKLLALDPNGADPSRRVVYVTFSRQLFKSTDAGVNFSLVGIGAIPEDSEITAIACVPGAPTRVWLGFNDSSVAFTADGANTWNAGSFQRKPGDNGPVTCIAIDPNNIDRVAVTYGDFPDTNPFSRTGLCFLTTDSGQSWIDASGTDGNPTGNLPNLAHNSVVFDTSPYPTLPSAIIVATEGGVLRSVDSGKTWKVLGAGPPLTDCRWLTIDNSVTPVVLKVATYGSSCFQFARKSGPRLWGLANLSFDSAVVGQTRSLPVRLRNYGDTNIEISGLTSSHAAFFWEAPLPLSPITPGTELPLYVTFKPKEATIVNASLQVLSNTSPLSIAASGQGLASPIGARLAVEANLSFPEVKTGSSVSLPVAILNTGTKDLVVQKFVRSAGSTDFDIVPAPVLPVSISGGRQQPYIVQFRPTSDGPLQATFEIVTDATIPSTLIEARGAGLSFVGEVLRVILKVLGLLIGT